jgi:branched-chain amino acid transport system ATP-binding protein
VIAGDHPLPRPLPRDAGEGGAELFRAEGVSRRFGGLQALSGVGMRIGRGQIYGLIGPNGAGKTTFFNIVTGLVLPDEGRLSLEGERYEPRSVHKVAQAGIARTFQNIRLFPDMTVLENVMVGRHVRTRSGAFSALVRTRAERAEERGIRARSHELLEYVGIPAFASHQARTLSYGDQRRLEIARALATEPRLLALDEPAAGMNATEKAELRRLLVRIRDDGVTLLLIEHDVALVMGLCDEVTVLDSGKVIAQGPPSSVQHDPAVIEAYIGKSGSAATLSPAFAASAATAGKPPILAVKGLRVAYGGIQAVKGIDLHIGAGELVALIGANGAGKTTTLKAITGSLACSGEIEFDGRASRGRPAHRLLREGLVMVPEGRGIFARMTVLENLQMGAYARDDRSEVARDIEREFERFPRLAERSGQLAGTLSGGEQQLLAMARALLSRPRLLLLDEPSMGLAPIMVEKIFEVVAEVSRAGVPVLLVEQNARLALQIARRGYVLESGAIALSGPARELLDDPRVKAAYLGEG